MLSEKRINIQCHEERFRILIMRPEGEHSSPGDQTLAARLCRRDPISPWKRTPSIATRPADLERQLAAWRGKIDGRRRRHARGGIATARRNRRGDRRAVLRRQQQSFGLAEAAACFPHRLSLAARPPPPLQPSWCRRPTGGATCCCTTAPQFQIAASPPIWKRRLRGYGMDVQAVGLYPGRRRWS